MIRNLLKVFALAGAFAWAPASFGADADDGRKCADNEEREGNICYPRCVDDGYTRYEGDGDECWQICPSNAQDYGHVCLMGPAQLLKKKFKRGPGRPLT